MCTPSHHTSALETIYASSALRLLKLRLKLSLTMILRVLQGAWRLLEICFYYAHQMDVVPNIECNLWMYWAHWIWRKEFYRGMSMDDDYDLSAILSLLSICFRSYTSCSSNNLFRTCKCICDRLSINHMICWSITPLISYFFLTSSILTVSCLATFLSMQSIRYVKKTCIWLIACLALFVQFKDAGGFEALVTGKVNDMQWIDVMERITVLERLNPTPGPTT